MINVIVHANSGADTPVNEATPQTAECLADLQCRAKADGIRPRNFTRQFF